VIIIRQRQVYIWQYIAPEPSGRFGDIAFIAGDAPNTSRTGSHMTKTLRMTLPLLAAALVPGAAMAQMGGSPTTVVPAGTYTVESHHTLAIFAINHMGFNDFYGTIPGATGSLTLDPAHAAADKLDVSLPVSAISTTNSVLDGELKDPSWLDAAKYPEIHFTATKVTQTGAHTAHIDGNLTLHGVTRPIALDATFGGAGNNPMSKHFTIGFSATGAIKRSDFGVTKYVPLIGDDVRLTITAAFEKQD
jgi:polyisoprenoid-binding protein YceI